MNLGTLFARMIAAINSTQISILSFVCCEFLQYTVETY